MAWKILFCCKFSLAENEEKCVEMEILNIFKNCRNDPESWKHCRTVLGKLQKLTQNFQKLQNSTCANCCCPDLFLLLFWLFCPPIWTQIEAQSLTQLPFDINWRIRLRKHKFWGLGAPPKPQLSHLLHLFLHPTPISLTFPFHLPPPFLLPCLNKVPPCFWSWWEVAWVLVLQRGVPILFLSLYIFDCLGLGYHLCFEIRLDLVVIVGICDFGL